MAARLDKVIVFIVLKKVLSNLRNNVSYDYCVNNLCQFVCFQ